MNTDITILVLREVANGRLPKEDGKYVTDLGELHLVISKQGIKTYRWFTLDTNNYKIPTIWYEPMTLEACLSELGEGGLPDIEKCKSDIACNRRYNWKSLIEYLIEEKSFDLINKTVDEVCRLYVNKALIALAKKDAEMVEMNNRLSNEKSLHQANKSLLGSHLDDLILAKKEISSLKEQIEKVRAIASHKDSGREGCKYGDTEYDSLSAVYGYNLAMEQIIEQL